MPNMRHALGLKVVHPTKWKTKEKSRIKELPIQKRKTISFGHIQAHTNAHTKHSKFKGFHK